VEFEWDELKSERNRMARGSPFEVAVVMFAGPLLAQVDSRRDYGEPRVRVIGVAGGLILTCVYTDRDARRRISSLHRANRRERDAYRAAYPD
jgi:uncharacterized protein